MRRSPVTIYVTGVCLVALVLLFMQDWGQLAYLAHRDYWGLATLALLALFAEQQALKIKIGRVSGGSSIGFLPLFTLVLLFGPAATVGTTAATGAIVEYLIRRKEPLRANFNIGQLVIATALGGMAFTATGGQALMELGSVRPSGILAQVVGPFVLFGVVVLWINNALVALVIALNQRMHFREVWTHLVGRSGTNIFYDLLIGPIAIAVAALYMQIGPLGLPLVVFPLLFIRRSYLTTQQLQLANRDLLTALVKAIETRDPYTSGHSRRVSRLARSIAVALNIPEARVNEIETAALLHDIGKIEGVYSEILMKPSDLSREERRVIESHVVKGAELLSSLTSLGDSVIMPVRYHHEHFDGSGYPEGLRGSAIPLGARIIKVCDAIDAMLSDRPYRKALAESEVYSQLKLYSGKQFDPTIVDAVLAHDLVRRHQDELREGRTMQ